MTTQESPSTTQISFFDGGSVELGTRGLEIIKVPEHSIDHNIFYNLMKVVPDIDAYPPDTPVKDVVKHVSLFGDITLLINLIKLGHILGLHFVCKVLGHHLSNIMNEATAELDNAGVLNYMKQHIGMSFTQTPKDNELYDPNSEAFKQVAMERIPTNTVYNVSARPLSDYILS